MEVTIKLALKYGMSMMTILWQAFHTWAILYDIPHHEPEVFCCGFVWITTDFCGFIL